MTKVVASGVSIETLYQTERLTTRFYLLFSNNVTV